MRASVSSSDPILQMTTPVTVLAKTKVVYVPISTGITDSDIPLTLTTTVGPMTATTSVIVHGPVLGGLALDPLYWSGSPSVKSGKSTTANVLLQYAAGPSGVKVELSTSDASLKVPAFVVVAPGIWRASFTVKATSLTAPKYTTISATYKGVTTELKVYIATS
jgi:hypothetical protein